MGGCVSLIFKIVLVVLVLIALVQLIMDNRALVQGEDAVFTRPRTSKGAAKNPEEDDARELSNDDIDGCDGYLYGPNTRRVDYPVLDLSIETLHRFYEESSPAMQKVTFLDNTGYDNSWTTRDTPLPETRSVIKKVQVPFNSWDSETSAIDSPTPPEKSDMLSIIEENLVYQFRESLKAMYQLAITNPDEGEGIPFFPHEMHAFVRFDRNQMASIKACQLQVALMNVGQLNAVGNSYSTRRASIMSDTILTGMDAPFVTWNPREFSKYTTTPRMWRLADASYFNPITNKTEAGNTQFLSFKGVFTNEDKIRYDRINQLSGSKVTTTEFLNWQLVFNYVNNQRVVTKSHLCDSKRLNMPYATLTDPVDASAMEITIDGPNAKYFADEIDPTILKNFVYYALLSKGKLHERVTVWGPGFSNGDGTVTIFVDRDMTNPIDFAAAGDPTQNLPTNAPVSWTCPQDWYSACDGCDCNCGALDPDCVSTDCYVSNTYGCEDATQFGYPFGTEMACSFSGECVASSDMSNTSASTVYLSQPCVELLVPGETFLFGIYNSEPGRLYCEGLPLNQTGPPPGWMCEDWKWNNGDCDCGCGMMDMDCCIDEAAPVAGCGPGEVCIPGLFWDDQTTCGEPASSAPSYSGAICDSPADSAPPAWICEADWFRDGLCDCGCGAPDPDCCDDVAGMDYVYGCATPSSKCTEEGECYDPDLGSKIKEYAEDCKACPGDLYYGEEPQKNKNGVFVCNYRPKGMIDARKNRHHNETLYSIKAFIDIDLPAFPEPAQTDRMDQYWLSPSSTPPETPAYNIRFSDHHPHVQTVPVSSVDMRDADGYQMITPSLPSGLVLTQACYGTVESAVGEGVSELVVKVTPFEAFPAKGPYEVFIQFESGYQGSNPPGVVVEDLRVMVESATTVSARSFGDVYQVLTLQAGGAVGDLDSYDYPPVGAEGVLLDRLEAGQTITELVLETADPHFGFGELDNGPEGYVVLRRAGTNKVMDVIHVDYSNMDADYVFVIDAGTGMPPPVNWTCPWAVYAADDGCDCGCGAWDPDCGVPGSDLNDWEGYIYDEESGRLQICLFDSIGEACGVTPDCDSFCDPTTYELNNAAVPCASGVQVPSSDGYWKRITTIPIVGSGHFLRSTYNEGDKAVTSGNWDMRDVWTAADYDILSVYSKFEIEMLRSDPEYLPEDRYKAHRAPPGVGGENFVSPQVLDAEFAMFQVPIRSKFDQLDLKGNLHKTSVAAGKKAASSWSLTRFMEPDFDEFDLLNAQTQRDTCSKLMTGAADLTQTEFFDVDNCIAEMPPTAELVTHLSIPVNEKWTVNLAADGEYNRRLSPEYSLDNSMVFYFEYDGFAETNELNFWKSSTLAKGSKGDEDPKHRTPKFGGSLSFRGAGAGLQMPAKFSIPQLPANPPLIKLSEVSIIPNLEETVLLVQCIDPEEWPTDEESIEVILEKFKDVPLKWDLGKIGGSSVDQTLALEPGFEYTLSADVVMFPVYSKGTFGGEDIVRWVSSVSSTGVQKLELPYNNRFESRLRFVLNVDPDSKQLLEVKTYTVTDFFSAVGSAVALGGLGAAVMGVYLRLGRKKVQAYRKKVREEMNSETEMTESNVTEANTVPTEAETIE